MQIGSQAVSVDAFDSALGVLTDVSISYEVNWARSSTVFGHNTNPNLNSTQQVDTQAQASSEGAFILSLLASFFSDVFLSSTITGCSSTRIRTVLCSAQGGRVGSDSGIFNISPGDLHMFLADGSLSTIDFELTNQQITSLTKRVGTSNPLEGSDLCRSICAGTIVGNIEIDYTYEAAPVVVPALSGLVGFLAWTSLLLVRRRRSA